MKQTLISLTPAYCSHTYLLLTTLCTRHMYCESSSPEPTCTGFSLQDPHGGVLAQYAGRMSV
jgi:hypothetical protein